MIQRFLVLLFALLLFVPTAEAQLGTVPNTFIEGTNIIDDLNENFTTAYSLALNRSGGTMTGQLTSQAIVPASTATYDIGSSLVKFRDMFLSRNLDVAGDFNLVGSLSDSNSAVTIADQLQLTSTSVPQVQFRYDSSNYLEASISSTGAVTFNAVGASQGFTFSDSITVSALTATSIAGTITASGAWTYTQSGDAVTLASIAPTIRWSESGVSANNGLWRMYADVEDFYFQTLNDSNSGEINIFKVSRTGTTVDTFNISAAQTGIQIGSASAPGLAFQTDTNTGIFQSSSDRIDFATGGTRRWTVETDGSLVPGADDTYDLGSSSNSLDQVYVGNQPYSATNAIPSILGSDSDTGIGFSDATVDLQLIVNGVPMLTASGSGSTVSAGVVVDVPLYPKTVVFASLFAAGNGAVIYCPDCTVASPCAGGGTGAIAKRLNGAWVCN